MGDVAKYYDKFTNYQIGHGINDRHKNIQKWLEQLGLQPEHDVLEIGCGIGTQTELLANYLNSNSKILAIDISPKSIEIAKKRLSQFSNIELVANDIIEYSLKGKYDVVLLPDVLEHIPMEQHSNLFKKISQLINVNGFVLIHIPEPHYLEWCEIHLKEKLQIIDQPIFLDHLEKNIRPHGLFVNFLSNYSIWIDNCDYRIIQLKKRIPLDQREYKIIKYKPSILERAKHKIKRIIKSS